MLASSHSSASSSGVLSRRGVRSLCGLLVLVPLLLYLCQSLFFFHAAIQRRQCTAEVDAVRTEGRNREARLMSELHEQVTKEGALLRQLSSLRLESHRLTASRDDAIRESEELKEEMATVQAEMQQWRSKASALASAAATPPVSSTGSASPSVGAAAAPPPPSVEPPVPTVPLSGHIEVRPFTQLIQNNAERAKAKEAAAAVAAAKENPPPASASILPNGATEAAATTPAAVPVKPEDPELAALRVIAKVLVDSPPGVAPSTEGAAAAAALADPSAAGVGGVATTIAPAVTPSTALPAAASPAAPSLDPAGAALAGPAGGASSPLLTPVVAGIGVGGDDLESAQRNDPELRQAEAAIEKLEQESEQAKVDQAEATSEQPLGGPPAPAGPLDPGAIASPTDAPSPLPLAGDAAAPAIVGVAPADASIYGRRRQAGDISAGGDTTTASTTTATKGKGPRRRRTTGVLAKRDATTTATTPAESNATSVILSAGAIQQPPSATIDATASKPPQ